MDIVVVVVVVVYLDYCHDYYCPNPFPLDRHPPFDHHLVEDVDAVDDLVADVVVVVVKDGEEGGEEDGVDHVLLLTPTLLEYFSLDYVS